MKSISVIVLVLAVCLGPSAVDGRPRARQQQQHGGQPGRKSTYLDYNRCKTEFITFWETDVYTRTEERVCEETEEEEVEEQGRKITNRSSSNRSSSSSINDNTYKDDETIEENPEESSQKEEESNCRTIVRIVPQKRGRKVPITICEDGEIYVGIDIHNVVDVDG